MTDTRPEATPLFLTYNICINGSRSFNDYDFFKQEIEKLIEDPKAYILDPVLRVPKQIRLILGGAQGADTLAERWAKEVGALYQVFPANWKKYGKSAGFKRNIQMIDVSHELISFWDGESRGTKHTIDYAKSKSVPVTIVNVPRETI